MKIFFQKIYLELYWIKQYYSIYGRRYHKPKIAKWIPDSIGTIFYYLLWILFWYFIISIFYFLYALLIFGVISIYDFIKLYFSVY
jgi:hypothetical protein